MKYREKCKKFQKISQSIKVNNKQNKNYQHFRRSWATYYLKTWNFELLPKHSLPFSPSLKPAGQEHLKDPGTLSQNPLHSLPLVLASSHSLISKSDVILALW